VGTTGSVVRPSADHRKLRFREFIIDLDRASLWRGEEERKLRPKSFEVLRYLAERPHRLVSKVELISALWPDSFVTDNSLVQCLLEIRRALDDESQDLIKTVARRGYLFEADVTADPDRGAAGLTVTERKPRTLKRTYARAAAIRHPLFWLGVPLALAAAIALAVYISGRASGSNRSSTLAVLPFQPVGAGSRDEYLELGMADALITRLSSVKQLIVRPTSSVRQYAGSSDAVAAGRRLGVSAVLDGTIQRLGGHVRVSVRLVRTGDGKTLWAESYDEPFRDIFSVQDAVSTQIARALSITLTGKEMDRLNKRYTTSAEAYELYIRGRYFWGQRTMQSLQKAISYFEQSTQKDPKYALAYAGLAFCYGPMLQRYLIRVKDGLPRLEAAAGKAIEFDQDLAEGHVAMAAARFNEWNFPGAESESKRALELNPNDSTAHMWYGYYLRSAGRRQEDQTEIQRAYELDPLNLAASVGIARQRWSTGRETEAFEQLRKTIEIDPAFPLASEALGDFHAARREYAEAIEAYRKTGDELQIAWAEAAWGREDAARKTLAHFLQSQPPGLPLQEMRVAAVHTALGEKEEAFRWLERAYVEHDPLLMFLKVDERFAALRSDPRYSALLGRVRG